jgi:hypothetical protein
MVVPYYTVYNYNRQLCSHLVKSENRVQKIRANLLWAAEKTHKLFSISRKYFCLLCLDLRFSFPICHSSRIDDFLSLNNLFYSLAPYLVWKKCFIALIFELIFVVTEHIAMNKLLLGPLHTQHILWIKKIVISIQIQLPLISWCVK